MRAIFAAICSLLLFVSSVGAMERFDIVTTDQLEKLLKDREAGQVDFLLVNTLDEIIFRDAAIPGSINLPLPQVDQKISRLGPDRAICEVEKCLPYLHIRQSLQ